VAAGWWRWPRAPGERTRNTDASRRAQLERASADRATDAVLSVGEAWGSALEDVGEAHYWVDGMNSPSGATQACCSRWLASVWGRSSWRPRDVLPGDLGLEEVLRERLGDLGVPVSGSAGAPGWIAGPADPAVNQGRHRSDGGHKKRAPTGTLRLDSITETDAIKRGSNFSSQRQRSLCS
jgi:hypothetical protein